MIVTDKVAFLLLKEKKLNLFIHTKQFPNINKVFGPSLHPTMARLIFIPTPLPFFSALFRLSIHTTFLRCLEDVKEPQIQTFGGSPPLK